MSIAQCSCHRAQLGSIACVKSGLGTVATRSKQERVACMHYEDECLLRSHHVGNIDFWRDFGETLDDDLIPPEAKIA